MVAGVKSGSGSCADSRKPGGSLRPGILPMIAHLHLDQLLHAVDSRWLIAAGVLAGWLIVLLSLKRIGLAVTRRIAPVQFTARN